MAMLKKVLSFSSGTWIKCNWFECDKPGYELHKTVFHEHAKNIACHDPRAGHVNFIFCSERHRQLYLHSHISLGDLPPGHGATL